MPLLKFRNFLSASRKHNMLQFGMFRSDAIADIAVIEDYSGADPLGIVGLQNGSNTSFTTSGVVGKLFVNGVLLSSGVDYTLTSLGFTLTLPPVNTDTILAFTA